MTISSPIFQPEALRTVILVSPAEAKAPNLVHTDSGVGA